MKLKQWHVALLTALVLTGCQATNQVNDTKQASQSSEMAQSNSENDANSQVQNDSVASSEELPEALNQYIEASIKLTQEIANITTSSDMKQLKADTFKEFQKVHNAAVEQLNLAHSFLIENNDIQEVQGQLTNVLTEIGKKFSGKALGELADLTKLSGEFQTKITELSEIAQDAQNKLNALNEKKAVSATVTLKVQGEDVENKVKRPIMVKAGTTLMDALKENFEIEETKGLITAIDQIVSDQDEHKGRYWKLIVNDKMAEVGANDIVVQDKDQITFDLTSEW